MTEELSAPLMAEIDALAGSVPDEQSAFLEDILKLIPSKAEESKVETATKLGKALEILMTRQMRDCRLIVDICVAIAKLTGLPSTKVVQVVQRASKKLNVPSPSWLAKNIRAARLIERHPELGEVRDVEKLVSLQRLPEGELDEVARTGTLIVTDNQVVDVVASTRKELTTAVRMKVAPPSLDDIDASSHEQFKRSQVDSGDLQVKATPEAGEEDLDLSEASDTPDSQRAGGSVREPEEGFQESPDEIASKIGKIRFEIDQLISLEALNKLEQKAELTEDLESAAEALTQALTRFKMSWESADSTQPPQEIHP